MSHDPHGAPVQSTGTITMGVKMAVAVGAMVAVMQGLFVELSSGYGHVWPAANSATIQLPPSSLNR